MGGNTVCRPTHSRITPSAQPAVDAACPAAEATLPSARTTKTRTRSGERAYHRRVPAVANSGPGSSPEPPSDTAAAAEHPDTEEIVDALRAVLIAGERYRSAVAERFGIGAVESVVLSLLVQAGQPLTPHQLSARMLVSSGTLSAILDRLERSGHVRRTPHPTDRRSRLIVLTAEGRRLLQFSGTHLRAAIGAAIEGADDPACRALVYTMRRISHLLDERAAIVRENP